jgi:hypothetical protein
MAFRDSFLRAPRRSDAPQKDRGKGQKHGGKMRPRTPERPASPPQECARSAMRVCGRLARSNGSITGLRAAVLQRAARRQRGVARGRRARAGRRYVAADSFSTYVRDWYHSHALLKGVNLCIFVLYTLLLCQPLVSPLLSKNSRNQSIRKYGEIFVVQAREDSDHSARGGTRSEVPVG